MNVINKINNHLLSLIITTGGIYTFSLGSASSTTILFKRFIFILFILLNLIFNIKSFIKFSIFNTLLILNILFLTFLIFINSKFSVNLYYIISFIFIISVHSYFKNISNLNKFKFLNTLHVYFNAFFIFFTFLLFLFFILGINEVRFLFTSGFGNDYANFSVWLSSLSLIISYIYFELNKINFKYFYFQIILLLLTFLSGGRTGFLLILLSIFTLLYFKGNIKKILFLFTIITTIIFLITTFLPDIILLNRFYTTSNTELSADEYSSGRLSILLGGFNAFLNFNILQFFFGLGTDNFYFNYGGEDYQIHNIFLKSLVETGIVGFIFLLTLYLFPIIKNYQFHNNNIVKIFYLIASLNAFISPSSFYTNLNVFSSIWVILAISQKPS
jgi:hypothetical protein